MLSKRCVCAAGWHGCHVLLSHQTPKCILFCSKLGMIYCIFLIAEGSCHHQQMWTLCKMVGGTCPDKKKCEAAPNVSQNCISYTSSWIDNAMQHHTVGPKANAMKNLVSRAFSHFMLLFTPFLLKNSLWDASNRLSLILFAPYNPQIGLFFCCPCWSIVFFFQRHLSHINAMWCHWKISLSCHSSSSECRKVSRAAI